MARTRFEEEGTIAVGMKGQIDNEAPNGDAIEMVPASAFHNKNPHTIRFIDPNLTEG